MANYSQFSSAGKVYDANLYDVIVHECSLIPVHSGKIMHYVKMILRFIFAPRPNPKFGQSIELNFLCKTSTHPQFFQARLLRFGLQLFYCHILRKMNHYLLYDEELIVQSQYFVGCDCIGLWDYGCKC